MKLSVEKNTVVDFTAFKIDRMATEFDRWGEDLVANALREVLSLYRADAIDVMWEEGMPIPITPGDCVDNESR